MVRVVVTVMVVRPGQHATLHTLMQAVVHARGHPAPHPGHAAGRVRIAQNDGKPPIDRLEHVAGGNQRAQA